MFDYNFGNEFCKFCKNKNTYVNYWWELRTLKHVCLLIFKNSVDLIFINNL